MGYDTLAATFVITFKYNDKKSTIEPRVTRAREMKGIALAFGTWPLETHPESTRFGAWTLSLAHVPASESFRYKAFGVIVHDASQAPVLNLRGSEGQTGNALLHRHSRAPATLSRRDAAAAPQQDSARAL